MNQTRDELILDRALEALSHCLDTESARRVVESQIDPVVQARIEVRAERANEGLLTEVERSEYEAYINADDFISILKLKVRRTLNSIDGQAPIDS